MGTASKATITLLIVTFISGCATNYRYYKPGASTTQHQKDDYECRREASYSQTAGMMYGDQALLSSNQNIDTEMLFRCLRARGYTVTIE